MRPRLALTALAVSLFVLSCTEDNREAPTEPSAASSSKYCPSSDPIQSQICALFPPNDLLKSASDLYTNVRTKKNQNKLADAQARAFDLVDFALKNVRAGKLLDPNGSAAPTTQQAVAQLTCDLLVYVNLSCNGFSADALGSNGTAQVVGPEGGLVLTPDKHSGVQVPPGAMPAPGLITITPIPATAFPPLGGPLPTDFDQYPLFRDYTLSASFDHFDKPVLVGICHLSVGDGPYAPPSQEVDNRLQLAHPDPNNTETIELLARENAPFLVCDDFNSDDPEIPPPIILSSTSGKVVDLASTSRRLLRRAVVPVLEALLPEPAEATMVGSCCLGGLTTKFSPFAAVDPQSSNELSLLVEPNDHTSDRNHFVGGHIRPCTNPPPGPGDGCRDLVVKMENVSGRPVGIGKTVTASLIVVNKPTGTTPALGGDKTQTIASVTLGEDVIAAATFTDLEIDQPGQYQIKFEAPGAASETSETFDVYKLEYTLQPTSEPDGLVLEGAFLGESDAAFANPVVRVSTVDYEDNVVSTASDPLIMFLPSNPALTLKGDDHISSANGVANYTEITEVRSGLTVSVTDGCVEGAPDTFRGSLLVFAGPAGGVSDQIVSDFFNVVPNCLPVEFGSSRWSYKQISSFDPVPQTLWTINPTLADGWGFGSAPFGSAGPCDLPEVVNGWAQATTMLLRRDILIPSDATSITLQIRIDGDAFAAVNGWGLNADGASTAVCGTPLVQFTIPASETGVATAEAPLLPGHVNKIFIRGVDDEIADGSQSYLDARITVNTVPPIN